jgi:hypothetical protein
MKKDANTADRSPWTREPVSMGNGARPQRSGRFSYTVWRQEAEKARGYEARDPLL